MRAIIAALPLLAVAACAYQADEIALSNAGYQAGYVDGCNTGQQRTGAFSRALTRNDSQYDSDDFYRRGWNEGFRTCGDPKPISNDPYDESQQTFYPSGPLN